MCGWALEFEFSQKQTLKQALESLYFIWEVKENTGRVGEKIKVGRKLVIYALSYQTEANWEDIRKKKNGENTHTHHIYPNWWQGAGVFIYYVMLSLTQGFSQQSLNRWHVWPAK